MKFLILAVVLILASCGARAQSDTKIRFEGEPRACAGGLADATHTIELSAQVSGATPVEFAIEGGDGVAFVAPDGAPTQNRSTLTPDANGRIALQIRGGAKLQTPILVARRGGVEVGRLTLDFAPPVQYRHFSNPFDADSSDDNGFLFSPNGKRGKIYLKFRKSWGRGDVNGNWEAVAGHRLRVYIAEVDARAQVGKVLTTAEEVARYGRVFSFENPDATECIVTTRADGTAQFGFQSTNFDPYAQITISAQDLTETENPAYRSSAFPAAQTIPEYGEKSPIPQWFDAPENIKARVMWNEEAPKGISHWKWSDINGAQRSAPQTLEIQTALDSGGYDAGAYNPIFSPDATRVLIFRGRPNQDMDGNHDTVLADLASGKSYGWRDYLFGASETWAPDGNKVGFVAGSLDVLGSGALDPPLRLMVRAAKMPPTKSIAAPLEKSASFEIVPNAETTLRTDDDLDRDLLRWTKNGDLLAVTNQRMRRKDNDPYQEAATTPLILRFKNGVGQPQIWQNHAGTPVPAPDGAKIAFFGAESAPSGSWNDHSPALGVADDNGKNRRTLTRVPDGISRAFFAPTGKVVLFNFSSDYADRGFISSPAFNKQPPNLSPIDVKIDLTEYDANTGARRAIAALSAVYRPWTDQHPPNLYDFEPLGLSRDGKYLFLKRREWQRLTKGSGQNVANSLHAVRLSDGKLLPLAVFKGDFVLASLSF